MKTLIILFFFVSCNSNTGTVKQTTNTVPKTNNVPVPNEEEQAKAMPIIVSAQDLVNLYSIKVSPTNGGYSYSPYNYGSLCVTLPVSLVDAKEILQDSAVKIGGDTLHYFELEINRENSLDYINYLDQGGEKLHFPKTLGVNNCDEHGTFKDSLQSIHGTFISECMKIPLTEFSGVTDNDKAIQQDLLCNKNR